MSEQEAGMISNDFKLQLGDGNSPEQFDDFCAVFELGEIGEEAPSVDFTTFCDDAMRSGTGLPDGMEIPLTANFKTGDEQIRALYLAFKSRTNISLRYRTKDSPADYWDFSAVVRRWTVGGSSVGERARASFLLKVSGGVNWTEGS